MYLDLSVANLFLIIALLIASYLWKQAKDETDEMHDDMMHILHLLYEKRATIYKTDEGYRIEPKK